MKLRIAIILGVLMIITLVEGQNKPGGGREGRRPRAPPRPSGSEGGDEGGGGAGGKKEGRRQRTPSNAKEGKKGRLEFALPSINREILVWPKGCVFGLRKLNCTGAGERCKPLVFALDTVKELDDCGGKEVGKAPGGKKRKRGADRAALKKLQCVIESNETCSIPESSVSAVCVNASAYLSNDSSSYFTFSLYIAQENGTFTFKEQTYNISKGQTKFTLGYVGKTCCSGDDSCSCDDGVTGALDVGLRIVGPPGKARKRRARGSGRGRVNEVSAGDAELEFPSVVDVDGQTAEIPESDFRIVDDGADSKIDMCIRNVSNYFLYDPIASVSSAAEQTDSTIMIDTQFGETIFGAGGNNSGATYPVITVTGFFFAVVLALMLH